MEEFRREAAAATSAASSSSSSSSARSTLAGRNGAVTATTAATGSPNNTASSGRGASAFGSSAGSMGKAKHLSTCTTSTTTNAHTTVKNNSNNKSPSSGFGNSNNSTSRKSRCGQWKTMDLEVPRSSFLMGRTGSLGPAKYGALGASAGGCSSASVSASAGSSTSTSRSLMAASHGHNHGHTTSSSCSKTMLMTPTFGPSARTNPISESKGNGAGTSGEGPMKYAAANSAVSARNILIRRKLMEKKRFDSADYAMNKPDSAPSVEGTAPPPQPQAAGPATTETPPPSQVQPAWSKPTPQTSPVAPSATSAKAVGRYGALARPNAPTSTSTSAATSTRSDSGRLAARNVLLQRKLMEKKRFDSADYQLKHFHKEEFPASAIMSASSAPAETPPAPPVTVAASSSASSTTASCCSSMSSPPVSTCSSSVSSPTENQDLDQDHPIPMVVDCDLNDAANEPEVNNNAPWSRPSPSSFAMSNVAPSSVPANPLASIMINSPMASEKKDKPGAQISPSTRTMKYDGLSGANILIRRKLAEKKRFDSADYQMRVNPTIVTTPSNQEDTGEPTPMETSPTEHGKKEESSRASLYGGLRPPSSMIAASPVAASAASKMTVPASVNARNDPSSSKYGKLSAANVLIRRQLKERKRFDSADYSMAKAKASATTSAASSTSSDSANKYGALSNQTTHLDQQEICKPQQKEPTSPELLEDSPTTSPCSSPSSSDDPQTKHIRLSNQQPWCKAASMLPLSVHQQKDHRPMVGVQDHRIAARNLILQRKLAERKRFDSADYFKTKG